MESENQLKLIQESIITPKKEEEAKKLLLKDLYEEVEKSYSGFASNGGKLVDLSECVRKYLKGERDTPCDEDMEFTYNGIRVLMSRYISRTTSGKLTETPSMIMRRVAEGFGDYVNKDRLINLLLTRKFMFNSPTLFNMYADGSKGALSACYVTPVYDNMLSIMEGTVVQAMTFKYGGGQGFSFSNLRPQWSVVKGTGSYSSGPLSFMKIYDTVTDSVKEGGKRRGANMGIMHVWHPDIFNPYFDPISAYRYLLPPQEKELLKRIKELIEKMEKKDGIEVSDELKNLLSDTKETPPEEGGFIQAKEGILGDVFLTNFNLSVGINDAFMKAVLENKDWTMLTPQVTGTTTGDGDYRIHYSFSKETSSGILGELLEKKEWMKKNPFINVFEDILSKSIPEAEKLAKNAMFQIDYKNPYIWKYPARKIWEKIVENAWKSGDPGLVLIDNHNKWSPTPWLGIVVATNPCGEQYLYPFESCNLGSISVEKYISNGKFDIKSFFNDVHDIIDAMDGIIDKNKHPDARQEKANQFTRKIGLGVMGLADALVKLDYPYDSEEAVAFTMVLMASLEVFSWKRSWELGKIRGPAPAFKCRMWDWRKMECVEEGRPEELVELHTPALVKAAKVMKIDDGWVKVKYHHIDMPSGLLARIKGVASERIERDGTIKLVRKEALEKVLREVFGIHKKDFQEAKKMSVMDVVNSPKHLIALAIYDPSKAWEILKEYGKTIGAVAPRNTVTTTVAPTGSISIIAGTSSGIEPYFALVYRRKVAIGEFLEVIREFRARILEFGRKYGLSKKEIEKIFKIISENKGSIRWSLKEIEKEIPMLNIVIVENGKTINPKSELQKIAQLFPTAMDFDVWYHIAHQSAAQIFVDQSISKTVNFHKDATIDDVFTVYLLGWLTGLKGVTIYRDESKSIQVIYFGLKEKQKQKEEAKQVLPPGNGQKVRMVLPKKIMKIDTVKDDPVLMSIAKVSVTTDNQVVVEMDENSTCKTCNT